MARIGYDIWAVNKFIDMSEDQINELNVLVAKLDTSNKFILKQLEESKNKENKLFNKLDMLLSQISQNSIENNEIFIKLKTSLKNHVSKEVIKLKEYHNIDMNPIKEEMGKNPMIKIGKKENRKWLIALAIIILVSFGEKIHGIVTKETQKYGVNIDSKFVKYPKIRGGGYYRIDSTNTR